MRMYLLSLEIKLRNRYLDDIPKHEKVLRLSELGSLLACTERWLNEVMNWELAEWVGISVDFFNQLTQCLIVLFKLASVEEPNWDTDEVRRRADVFKVLDHCAEAMEQVPKAVGMVDATEGRHGLWYKGTRLIHGIKVLMLAEMAKKKPQWSQPGSAVIDTSALVDYQLGTENEMMPQWGFPLNIEYEPWLSDLFVPSWDLGQEILGGFTQ